MGGLMRFPERPPVVGVRVLGVGDVDAGAEDEVVVVVVVAKLKWVDAEVVWAVLALVPLPPLPVDRISSTPRPTPSPPGINPRPSEPPPLARLFRFKFSASILANSTDVKCH